MPQVEDWVLEEVLKVLDKWSLEEILERLDIAPKEVLRGMLEDHTITIEELLDASE
jgi:hypothetical protein